MKPWHLQTNDARTWADLIQAARDYIASLSPEEWSSVPSVCRPERIKGIDDLSFWHRRLTDEYLGVVRTSGGNDVMRDMLAFFTTASERAAEMVGSATSPNEDAMNDDSRRGRAENRQPGK